MGIHAADDATCSFVYRHSQPPALTSTNGFAGPNARTGQSRDHEGQALLGSQASARQSLTARRSRAVDRSRERHGWSIGVRVRPHRAPHGASLPVGRSVFESGRPETGGYPLTVGLHPLDDVESSVSAILAQGDRQDHRRRDEEGRERGGDHGRGSPRPWPPLRLPSFLHSSPRTPRRCSMHSAGARPHVARRDGVDASAHSHAAGADNQITLTERGLSGRECPAQLSKIHRAAEPGSEMA